MAELLIHRGARQIGGSVIELRTETTRIFLDMGSPLPGPEESGAEAVLSIPGVTQPGEPCQGVFFTHTHGDHMGQIGHILPTVPLFLGEASREVARILYRRLSRCAGLDVQPVLSALERAHTFQPGRTLTIGNIRITPLLVDHSAFDAYMFLLESDGVRLLYTGDFRNHGPRGKALLPVLRRYVGQVDWLICEGTTLSRPQGRVLTEWELGSRARAVMQAHRHVFVLCASTNIDRIATLAHCAPRGRPVICDGYQKEILNCVEKLSGSKSGFYRFDRVIPYFAGNYKLRKWMEEAGFLSFVRVNRQFRAWMDSYRGDGVLLYSMWEGYRSGPSSSHELAAFPGGVSRCQPPHQRPCPAGDAPTGLPDCGPAPRHSPRPW